MIDWSPPPDNRDYNLYDYKERDLGYHSSSPSQNSQINGALLEAIYQALQAIDASQTHYTGRNPQRLYEENPIMGKHPSKDKINAYFGATGLGHAALSYALPDPWDKIFQMLSIGVEGGQIMDNKRTSDEARF
jgi:hypothetical protein